jgi:hypothetical protein
LFSAIVGLPQSEDIYRQAALRLVGSGPNLSEAELTLKEIGKKKTNLGMLGPIEKAELIRTFAFRSLPIEQFENAIYATEELTVITKCNTQDVALFVADLFLLFSPTDGVHATLVTDNLYESIKITPVPPEEYFLAFQKSRRLVVS